jgi:hypothetical protein
MPWPGVLGASHPRRHRLNRCLPGDVLYQQGDDLVLPSSFPMVQLTRTTMLRELVHLILSLVLRQGLLPVIGLIVQGQSSPSEPARDGSAEMVQLLVCWVDGGEHRRPPASELYKFSQCFSSVLSSATGLIY